MRTLSQSSSCEKAESQNALDWYPSSSLPAAARDSLAEALLDRTLSEDARNLVRALAVFDGRIDVGDVRHTLWLEFAYGLVRPRLRRAARELFQAGVIGYDGTDLGLELVASGVGVSS